jgi:hypothetical protein
MRESSFKRTGFAALIDPKGDIPHKLIADRATRWTVQSSPDGGGCFLRRGRVF